MTTTGTWICNATMQLQHSIQNPSYLLTRPSMQIGNPAQVEISRRKREGTLSNDSTEYSRLEKLSDLQITPNISTPEDE